MPLKSEAKTRVLHAIESAGVTLAASLILAGIYERLGMGDFRQLFWLGVFSFVTALGSFASEYDAPGARPRLYGSASLALGLAASLLGALPALPSDYRTGAWASGALLTLAGGVTLTWVVRREAASAVGHEAPLRAAVATASSVVGILGSPFLTYLLLR